MPELKRISDDYRNTSKSDHMASIDILALLEVNERVIMTIKSGKQYLDKDNYKINGRAGKYNIVRFNEHEKPWRVNGTNCAILRGFANTFSVSQWKGLTVELYVDPDVMMAGEKVGGIKIRTIQPEVGKQELTPMGENWQVFKERVNERICEGLAPDHVRSNVEENFIISDENWQKLCG